MVRLGRLDTVSRTKQAKKNTEAVQFSSEKCCLFYICFSVWKLRNIKWKKKTEQNTNINDIKVTYGSIKPLHKQKKNK